MAIKRIGLLGASGRTGQYVLECLPEFPGFQLSAALVSDSSGQLGKPTGASGVNFSSDIAAAVEDVDVFIDFSVPAASVEVSKICSSSGVPLVVCTTGHTAEQLVEIAEAAATTAVVMAPNSSLGIALLNSFLKVAAARIEGRYDVSIHDVHHRNKMDAPSGTAKLLLQSIEDAGVSGVQVSSSRIGDVKGEHTIKLYGAGEEISLTHRVEDRRVFACGALELAERAFELSPGMYSAGEAFGLVTS